MIDWNEFYADGGYNGTCDPASYDDGIEDEKYSELEECESVGCDKEIEK